MKYKISELAKLAGVSTRTLRYYDQIGILKSKRIKDSNYRYYDDQDVDTLQQILLFRSMDMPLEQIKAQMMNLSNHKRIKLLNEHLAVMTSKQLQIQTLITTIQKTIKVLKGDTKMSNNEKFEGLKETLIEENDKLYKTEVIANWGKDNYEKSRNQFKNMTKETFDHFNNLNQEIIETLKLIKQSDNESNRAKVYKLHKEWITIAWGFYDKEIHLNVVDMYIQDERFKKYYDTHGEGLAQILRDSVHHFSL